MYNAAIKLLKEINNKGFVSYIVGGYPRDLYLKRTSKDIDICTNATPKELKKIFGDAMLPKVNYGSVTVIKNRIRFEITTFRKEIKYLNNRIPVEIEYIDNLLDDLKRRDFTINTLCIDSEGNIIDLLDGKKDLDDKIIRMVGSPKIKLEEDALRILRAIRFATILNFKLDDELKKYITKYRNLLKKLSYDRKKEELEKIFSSNARYGLDLIKELKLDKALDIKNIDDIVPTNSLGIWAQMDVLDKYPFSKEERKTIDIINKYKNIDLYDINNLYECAKNGMGYLYTICNIKRLDFKEFEKKYINLPIKNTKEININLKEISSILNKKEGPYIKDIISDIEYKILHQELLNNESEIKKYILDSYN